MIRKSTAALLTVLLLPVAANAGIISFSDSLPDYSSDRSSSGFPIDLGDIGTFLFPTGDLLDATISGTWGNLDYPFGSAGADVYLDGLLVAQCVANTSCWQDTAGPELWSYTLSTSDLASGLFDDGMAVLNVVQTSAAYVRLGSLTLEGSVAVPEPGTLVLIGMGLFATGLVRRRRKV